MALYYSEPRISGINHIRDWIFNRFWIMVYEGNGEDFVMTQEVIAYIVRRCVSRYTKRDDCGKASSNVRADGWSA